MNNPMSHDNGADDRPSGGGQPHRSTGAIHFSSFLRESAAVLAAIIAAFALDAWWDGFVEQRLLDDQFAAIETELVEVLAEVERTTLPGYLSRMERFLELNPEDVEALPDASVSRSISQLGLWTFDAGTSVTRALAASPVLANSRPDLVPLAMRLPQLVDDLSEDATRVELRRQRCADRLVELGLYRSMWLIDRERAEEARFTSSEVLRRQLEDAEYRSCIAALHVEREVYTEEVIVLGAAADALLKAIPD